MGSRWRVRGEGGRGSWADRSLLTCRSPWKPGKGPELYLKYTRSRWHSVSGILARQRWPGFKEAARGLNLGFLTCKVG